MISLKTERLYLRPILDTDLNNFVELDTDPEVVKYISAGIPTTIKELTELLPKLLIRQEGFINYGTWMADLSNGENIGWFTFKPLPSLNNEMEVGYRLKKRYWGNGFATEGCRFLVNYGFEILKAKKIIAVTHLENIASQHVLQKCGLKKIGPIPNPFRKDDPDCFYFEKII